MDCLKFKYILKLTLLLRIEFIDPSINCIQYGFIIFRKALKKTVEIYLKSFM